LIINGVAGSGKTSIGYHRLAYLLSPENELNLGLDVSRALVLGPNAYFMTYASSVLPGLSLQAIRHTTYDEWAMRSMDFVVDGKDGRRLYRLHDGTLGKLLSPQSRPQEIDAYVRRSRLKGQLKFASLIERLAESARELGSSPTIKLAGLKGAKPVTLSPADWVTQYARALSSRTSVSGQQEELIRRLEQVASRRVEVSSEDREEVAADWRVRIENAVHQVWPRFDFREAYYDLLKDRSKLKRFGDGILTDQEMQLLATSPRTPERNVDIEDLPGLHYLHLLTEREGQPRIYDHVVVDEGQDLSPLQYLVLRRHVKNGGLTVLGDLAQGVHRYRGISDWVQVAEALGANSDSVRKISQSYRSTKEIVAFANALLEKVNPDSTAARPIDRSGERPRIIKSGSSGEMLESVARDARKLLDSGYKNVAVIAKGTRVRRAVARALSDQRVRHEVLSLESLSSLNEGVSVVPVELAKGVEYEAVLVVDVTKTQYGKRSWLDAQLLYVAVTRALHHLDLYFHAEPSPYLEHLLGEYGVKAGSK
jgi:DNA helicase-2/ATP-dependent DNA helicase PcrA